jgi:hypothetical protein
MLVDVSSPSGVAEEQADNAKEIYYNLIVVLTRWGQDQ